MLWSVTLRRLFPAVMIVLAVAATTGLTAAAPPGRLAFVSFQDGATRITTVRADGTGRRHLTPPGGAAHSPGWSPDGRRIVYAAQRDGRWRIYVMNADGSRRRRLTSGTGDHIFPAWSPDGRRIAFVRRLGADEQIDAMSADGSHRRRLTTSPGKHTVPTWSPDGQWIAFVSTRDRGVPQLFVMRPDGGGVRQLSRPERYVSNAYAQGEKTLERTGVLLRPGMLHPAWSPDSRSLAFVTRVGRAEQQISIVDVDGGAPRRLSTGYAPAWSPDGGRIAFVVARVGDSQIYVMNTDGTGLRRLTSEGANMLPAWSRHGRWLAFLYAGEGGLGLYVMRPDGTGRRRLGDAGGDLTMGPSLSWQP